MNCSRERMRNAGALPPTPRCHLGSVYLLRRILLSAISPKGFHSNCHITTHHSYLGDIEHLLNGFRSAVCHVNFCTPTSCYMLPLVSRPILELFSGDLAQYVFLLLLSFFPLFFSRCGLAAVREGLCKRVTTAQSRHKWDRSCVIHKRRRCTRAKTARACLWQ